MNGELSEVHLLSDGYDLVNQSISGLHYIFIMSFSADFGEITYLFAFSKVLNIIAFNDFFSYHFLFLD